MNRSAVIRVVVVVLIAGWCTTIALATKSVLSRRSRTAAAAPFVFEPAIIDLGEIIEGRYAIKGRIVNRSNSAAELREIVTQCSCTSFRATRGRIDPGGHVTYDYI